LGVLYPYSCTDGGEIWRGGGDDMSTLSMLVPMESHDFLLVTKSNL